MPGPLSETPLAPGLAPTPHLRHLRENLGGLGRSHGMVGGMALNYAQEEMRKVIDELACTPASLAHRLEDAYVLPFVHVMSDAEAGDYLPKDLTQRMRMLSDRMTSADVATGAVRATLAEMDDAALTHCAFEMVDIALNVLRVDA
jgi:hypothetical protein